MQRFMKVFNVFALVLLMFLFVGCNDATTTDTTATTATTQESSTTQSTSTTGSTTGETDGVAPVIVVNQDNIIIQTDTSFDYAGYVTVSDNVTETGDLVIEVQDWGGFDISVEGNYTVTVKVTDEAGNFSTATLNVEVKSDILAPMLTGSITTITHLAGEEIDLTKGLTGVDNVDGTNVIFTVSNLNDYDNDVPGTYTIQIILSDSAGNESNPINRTIVVENSYARAEMVSFEGEIIRHEALYNPQVLNGNTATGYNTAYNGSFVNVLSKDYLEWLLEYAPERIGSGVGWSIVAVTNADEEIVYVRHWNSGEAYLEDGDIVSVLAEEWSTGSNRSWSITVGETVIPQSNARYGSGEMGLMLANINQWVPEDGHVFIFMNWTDVALEEDVLVAKANTPDMPRSMGANYIMNSDEDGDDIKDYALGRTLQILDPQLSDESVRTSFDADNPFPIISVPSLRYAATGGVWKERYTQTVFLDQYSTENPYNPLTGITANDGEGNDITDQVSYKIYRYQTAQIAYDLNVSVPITDSKWADLVDDPWTLSANEVQLQDILVPANNGIYFVVEYQVTANGHTDTAYNLIKVATSSPDYIELYDDTDTVYSKVMGVEQRLEMNPDLVEFGPFDQTDRGIIYEADFFNLLASKPEFTEGVVVVIDQYYKVQEIRFSKDSLVFALDSSGESITATFASTHMLDGIVVPADGYLLIYPKGLDDEVIDKAVKAFYDYDYLGEELTTFEPVNGFVEVSLVIKEVQEVSTLKVDGDTATITVNSITYNVEVISNNKTALIHNPALGGAGFRSGIEKVYLYDDVMYEAFLADTDVVNSFTNIANNLGVPWFNNGVVMVFDENGDFVLARLGVGAAAEVHADGTFLYGAAITNWDVTVYNGTVVHGLLANILDDVPEGGSFMIFPYTSTPEVRNLAIGLVWNTTYPGGGAIVDVNADPAPTNPETLGFDATTFTASYFSALDISVDYVATIVDKAAKIAKPVISINGVILSWTQNANAASYDLYYDGLRVAEDIGVLNVDGVTYEYDLSQIMVAEGTYQVQLRAITADSAVAATSVLSEAVAFEVARLGVPTNFVRTDNVLTWDVVDGASEYYVSINGRDFEMVSTNEIVLPDADIINGVLVQVYASGSTTLFDSLVADYTLVVEIIPMEVVLGDYTLPIKEFIVASWMRYVGDGDVGAQFIDAFVVVNNAEDFLALDDATRVFAGGYAVVLDSDMNVKYIFDRWGHEWNAVDGWTTNAGGWTYGANIYVSNLRPYLAAGDTVLFASQYTTGLEAGTWRNYFGNALIFDLGVVTTDHRGVDLLQAIDPTTVTIIFQEQVTTKTVSLGTNDLPLIVFGFDQWLNYIDPLGSNDVGAANVAGIIMVEGAYGISLLDDTDTIFAGGYSVLLDSDMNIKYIADRWGHEWNAVDGWTTNVGAWTYGATHYASYFKPYLAEGDILILASQYTNGLPAGTYRNYLGNALIKDLGTVTADHRNVVLAEAIDPTTRTISIKETTSVLKIGNAFIDYRLFELDNWMTYAESDPGADGIHGVVVVSGAEALLNYDDADRIFAGGTLILLDSSMNVKYVVDRWSNVWTPELGWVEMDTNWAYGANVYVSYIKSLVAAGDYLIMAGQYNTGLPAGSTYRDVVGNQILSNLGAGIYTGDHRNINDFTEAIDPSTVTISMVELG